MKYRHSLLLLGLLLIALLPAMRAQAACSLSSGAYATLSIPLQHSALAIGDDVPDGTVLYQMTFRSNNPVTIACTTSRRNFTQHVELTSTPYPLSTWSGSGNYGNKVYETNLKGVGVAFRTYPSGAPVQVFPFTLLMTMHCVSTTSCLFSGPKWENAEVVLIKTGPISPGVLNASSLPAFRYMAGHDADLVAYSQGSFTGAISFTRPTCMAPTDVPVNMGTWSGSDYLKAKGDATAWRDASIHLTNCGHFIGKNTTSWWDDSNWWKGPGEVSSVAPLKPNTWSLHLAPTTPILDSANGIFAVDGSVADAASGVGIQLAYGSAGGSSTPLSFSSDRSGNFPQTGVSTVTIPLLARYIRTDDQPFKTGVANGRVIYTLSYR